MEPGISTGLLGWCLSRTHQKMFKARRRTGSRSEQRTLPARSELTVVSGKWAEVAYLRGLGIMELAEMWGQRHTHRRQKTERGTWGEGKSEGGKQRGKGQRTENGRDTERRREEKEARVGTKGERGSNTDTKKQTGGWRERSEGEGVGTGAELGVRARVHTHIVSAAVRK